MALIYSHYLIGTMLFINMLFLVLFSYVDRTKKRDIEKKLKFSVLMGVFNEEKFIDKSIKSIYESFGKNPFELFVINDASTDNTLQVLKKLQKKYKFKLVNNKTNKGRVISVNDCFSKTRGEIILILDSDLIFNKLALKDMIKRFSSNPKVGAVSCKYSSLNKGFLPLMQSIEYNFLGVWHQATSLYSSVGMFGGCMAIKKEAYKEAGMLSPHALTDDTDMAAKLTRLGWKVEQSDYGVKTLVPDKLNNFVKQKIRWGSGFMQVFLTRPLSFLQNPVFISIVLIGLFFIILATNQGFSSITGMKIIEENFSLTLKKNPIMSIFFALLVYPIFSLPYVSPLIRNKNELYKSLLIYPFSIIYIPLTYIVYFPSFFLGAYRAITVKPNQVLWKGERPN